MNSPSPAQLRASIANAVSCGDIERATERRRDYYTEVLAQKIAEVFAKAPPLRPEQIDRLQSLIVSGGSDGGTNA